MARKAIPFKFQTIELVRQTLGHYSEVFIVLFDRTGKYIITGADDALVKLWSAVDGKLHFTFRAATDVITDIAINIENTLLAASSMDRNVHVWYLNTGALIDVLSSHRFKASISTIQFCPTQRGYAKNLITTSSDGSVELWRYTTSSEGKTNFA